MRIKMLIQMSGRIGLEAAGASSLQLVTLIGRGLVASCSVRQPYATKSQLSAASNGKHLLRPGAVLWSRNCEDGIAAISCARNEAANSDQILV
jgi:hypothetical protein